MELTHDDFKVLIALLDGCIGCGLIGMRHLYTAILRLSEVG
jgi:hypothetical protein